jgi:HD-like signal output (HDOD) protein
VRPPTPKAASIAKESLRPRVPVEPPLDPEIGVPPFELPAALAAFQPVRHDALDAEPKQAIVAALRRIPRPPPSLRQLVSREFVSKATSPELSALVMGEPLIAAKVLAAVNSPFYGLQKSVVSIGQAVTFLGFNTVRSVGLRYMLSDSFKAGSPDLERVFNTIWSSSAFASELCLKLAQKLALADQGSLATHMVLSFIGRFATYSLLPAHVAVSIANLCLLERVKVEQAQLGLGSAEIGGLLMQEWALPPSIIQDVRDVDSILVTPPEAMDAERGARLALCYLCARLGERLAQGSLDDLAEFDLMAMKDADFFQLKSYLQRPALARLLDYLHAPDLLASLAQMQESMKAQK